MNADAYKNRIETMLQNLHSADLARLPFNALIRALGCPGMRYYGRRWNVDTPPPPPTRSADVVAGALRIAVHWYRERPYRSYEDTLSLLTGLAAEGRWRYCTASPDSVYDLAILLFEFSLTQAPNAPKMTPGPLALYMNVAPLVHALLSEWLRAEVPLTQAPSTGALLRSMFGEAWCDLFVSDRMPAIEITQLIQMQRPPFQPGLAVCQTSPDAIALPAMEQL